MRFKEGITEKNIIVKCGADKILPFALVFGIYIILFGTISPGGGFQGGVMVASAGLLIYLGYDYATATKDIKMEVLRVSESLGAILYVLLGFCGIIAGAVFCRNIFFDSSEIGEMLSAGNITFMGYSVGIKVLTGVGFLLLLMLGLLAPNIKNRPAEGEFEDDEEDEEDEALSCEAGVMPAGALCIAGECEKNEDNRACIQDTVDAEASCAAGKEDGK